MKMYKPNNIYNEDFRNGLDKIDEEYIIITDPPYNIGFEYENYQDDLSECEYIDLIGNFKGKKLSIIHYPEETMKYFVPALGVPNEVGVWCYNSNLPNRHSRLINYYNVKPNLNNVKQPYKNPNDKRIQKRIQSGISGARSYDWFNDIQLVKNVEKDVYNHPCPVPVELIERIILLTTKEGDLVVDPFMGSGTTAIACLKTNRRYIGFELSKEYYETSIKRINEHININNEEKQLSVFDL